jgi:hypothetical protein
MSTYTFADTYTPTITNVNNVGSSNPYACQYMRVGKVVTVSGTLDITATSNNTQTNFRVSLPIASNFATQQQCAGAGYKTNNTNTGHGISVTADTTNNEAYFDYYETHGGADTFSFTFTYQII